PLFPQPSGFESSAIGEWSAEGGGWQIGAPTDPNGPAAFSGEQVAGIILHDSYSPSMDSRLATPEFLVPDAAERPRLKYVYWYRLASGDFGQVQVRLEGGEWLDIEGDAFGANTEGEWSQRVIDLRPWAGQRLQVGFRFTTDSGTGSTSI